MHEQPQQGPHEQLACMFVDCSPFLPCFCSGNTGANNKGSGNTGDSNNGQGNTGAFNNGIGNTGA